MQEVLGRSRRRCRGLRTGLVAAAVAAHLAGPSTPALAAAPVTIRAIAVHGDPAPGTSETFGLFNAPLIDAIGTVIFSAGVTPSNGQQGIWKAPAGGALAPVAIDGGLAPGGSASDTWRPSSLPHVDDEGGVAFQARVTDEATISAVFGPDGAGGVRRIVDTNTVPPGIPPGAEFASVGNLIAHGPFGDTAIRGSLRRGVGGVDTTNSQGLWLASKGAPLELMLRAGDPAPAAIPGAVIDSLSEQNFGQSRALVGATLRVGVGGVTPDDAVTIWGMTPMGIPELLFRSSTLPPPADTTPLAGAHVLSESSAGELMFAGHLDTPGFVSELLGRVDAGGVLDIVALSGDPAPGISGHYFHAFIVGSKRLARFAPDGSIIFVARYKDATRVVGIGVWKRDPAGTISLLSGPGTQISGFPPDVTFRIGAGFLAVNRHGDLATLAVLQGTTPNRNSAIVFCPWGGVCQVVIREGDLLEVAPGDLREITGFSLTEVKRGTRTYLNDRRELAFKAVYRRADGLGHESGVFVAQIHSLPPIMIDIKPGSESNPIPQSGQGRIPVAILGSGAFNVLDVDVTTLAIGPGAAAPAHDLTKSGAFEDHLQDVNDDGLTDLIAHYRIQESGIEADDAEACITGETLGGVPFEGCDAIRAVATERRMRR